HLFAAAAAGTDGGLVLGDGPCVPRVDDLADARALEQSNRVRDYLRSVDQRLVLAIERLWRGHVRGSDDACRDRGKHQRALRDPGAGVAQIKLPSLLRQPRLLGGRQVEL